MFAPDALKVPVDTFAQIESFTKVIVGVGLTVTVKVELPTPQVLVAATEYICVLVGETVKVGPT